MSDLNQISNQFFDRREAMRPTTRTWMKHIGLLLITFFTVTLAGTLEPFGIIPIFDTSTAAEPQTWGELGALLLSLPGEYIRLIGHAITQIFTVFTVFKYGISFSLSLIFILLSHELGHYIACRIYGVDATLPFFLPTPPLIGPAGTFGAFIKIVSPMPSRRAVFDIGVAGPIAGFIALIPVALIAFFTHQPIGAIAAENPPGTLVFSNPLFYKFLAWIFSVDLQISSVPNPFYFAAWVGLLVTALNLIPSGQLDGGHAIYAVFGTRFHRLTGIVAFVIVVILAISGWYFYNSPSGFLFAVILFFMMRVRHPAPLDDTPLDFKRKITGVLTLLIFILSFTPFPIQIR